MQRRVVTIFGSGTCRQSDDLYAVVRQLAATLACAGFVICNGGYGGTMAAAARGAVEAGGHTIGVTCSAFRRRANPYVREVRTTATLLERLDTLVRLGDAYVVLPGGTGTLLELAYVWELINKRLTPRRKPLVIWNSFWEPVLACVRQMQPSAATLHRADGIEDVVKYLQRRLLGPAAG